jgi:hypothetical protein
MIGFAIEGRYYAVLVYYQWPVAMQNEQSVNENEMRGNTDNNNREA